MASRGLAFSLAVALLAPALPAAAQQGQVTGAYQPEAPEWLDGDVAIVLGALTEATVEGSFAVHKATVSGRTSTAQDLRDAYRAAAAFSGGDAFVGSLENGLRSRLEGVLRGVFSMAEVTVSAVVLDRAGLTAADGADPYHPPVTVAFRAGIAFDPAALGLEDAPIPITEDTIRAALDIGARVRLPWELAAQPGWNVTFAFTMPAWARVASAEGASIGPDARTATWELANWRGLAPQRMPADIVVRGADAPQGTASDARVELAIDMKGIEGLTIPSLLAGDFGSLLVRFDASVVARSLRVADFPALEQALASRLPSAITLDGVNADGLRLAAREGLLPPTIVAQLEAAFFAMAEERVAAFGQGQAPQLEGGFAADAFDAAAISSPLDGDPPLVYRIGATFKIPLKPGDASRLSAALGPVLYQRELSFALPRLQGLDTTYRITLPQGIGIDDVRVEGGQAQRASEGGRDVLVVTPEEDDAQVAFAMTVTGEFVVAQFWYLWLGVLLLAALGVAMRMYRKRKGRAKPQAMPEPEAAPARPPGPEPGPAPEGTQPSR